MNLLKAEELKLAVFKFVRFTEFSNFFSNKVAWFFFCTSRRWVISSTFGHKIDFSPYWCSYQPVLIGTLRIQIKEGGGLFCHAREQFPQNQTRAAGLRQAEQCLCCTCFEELQGGSSGIHYINLPCPKLTPICFKVLLIWMLKSLASAFNWGYEQYAEVNITRSKIHVRQKPLLEFPWIDPKKDSISALSPWFPHVTLVLYTVMSPW